MPFPSCDMAQDKGREMINSATEAARQLIDVIFDINCVANKWPSYAACYYPTTQGCVVQSWVKITQG